MERHQNSLFKERFKVKILQLYSFFLVVLKEKTVISLGYILASPLEN